MQESKDLKLTHAEKDALAIALSGIEGFNAEACFAAVNDDYFFIPEQVCTSPAVVLALVKFVLAHTAA